MANRGWVSITLKNGQQVHFNLEERIDGYYFANQRVSALRNWRLAEQKAKVIFRKIVAEYQAKGQYKDSYSSMWFEKNEGFNYTYAQKPKVVTPLKRYGTNYYNLEFRTNTNIKNIVGKWVFDETFYAISWMPTAPTTLQITKTVYKNGSQVSKEKLSNIVPVTNDSGVKALVSKFKQLYNYHKKTMGL